MDAAKRIKLCFERPTQPPTCSSAGTSRNIHVYDRNVVMHAGNVLCIGINVLVQATRLCSALLRSMGLCNNTQHTHEQPSYHTAYCHEGAGGHGSLGKGTITQSASLDHCARSCS